MHWQHFRETWPKHGRVYVPPNQKNSNLLQILGRKMFSRNNPMWKHTSFSLKWKMLQANCSQSKWASSTSNINAKEILHVYKTIMPNSMPVVTNCTCISWTIKCQQHLKKSSLCNMQCTSMCYQKCKAPTQQRKMCKQAYHKIFQL